MAKSRTDDLFERLHAQGLRKRTAKLLSQATDRRRKPAKAVERSLNDVKRAVAQVEDRISGGPAKRQAATAQNSVIRALPAPLRPTMATISARPTAKFRFWKILISSPLALIKAWLRLLTSRRFSNMGSIEKGERVIGQCVRKRCCCLTMHNA